MLIKRLILAFLCLSLLSGCESLKIRNLGKSGASAGVASLATSMAYDEIIPDQPSVEQIETKEQATAYIAESLFMNLLYGGIAYLIITLIAVPFIRRWGYNQAKKKYNVQLNKDIVDQIKDKIKNE